MILQALVSYYETLSARGELPQPGWAPVKVSSIWTTKGTSPP